MVKNRSRNANGRFHVLLGGEREAAATNLREFATKFQDINKSVRSKLGSVEMEIFVNDTVGQERQHCATAR